MRLHFVSSYKSIEQFDAVDLPGFVVLTGVNGAGKSHLLNAINEGHIHVEGVNQRDANRPIRMFDAATLVPNGAETYDRTQSRSEKEALWNEWQQYSKQRLQTCRSDIAGQCSSFENADLTKLDSAVIPKFDNAEQLREFNRQLSIAKERVQAYSSAAEGDFVSRDATNRRLIVDAIKNQLKDIPAFAWTKQQFLDNFPPSWMPVDIFQQSFARLFTEYASAAEDNDYKDYRNQKYEEENLVLSTEEFLRKFGQPPWDYLNEVLRLADLDFRINKPYDVFNRSYTPILRDNARGVEIDFSSLSSGEKVIMSFALCLYYAQDDRQLVHYPKVMLFDEIDAPLHPSMTMSLLRTIKESLVDKRGIKVILTTHSPSTVALAPEGSLYAMTKSAHKRLAKVSKDEALTILLAGVPSLSIDYENRRQVFVESQYDVTYYEKIYQLLRTKLNPSISLSFMAAGTERGGGCDTLDKIVTQLTDAGNRKVFGVVDWDLKNSDSKNIKVLGQGIRYTIENYLLDPVLVAALLEKERAVSKAQLGLSDEQNYMDLAKADSAVLQRAADYVIDSLQKRAPNLNNAVVRCTYLNGAEVDIPKWYLEHDGHSLEKIVKEAFPGLNRFHKTHSLKVAVIDHVLVDIPGLIPVCFFNLFEKIQQH